MDNERLLTQNRPKKGAAPNSLAQKSSTVLHIGCGRGAYFDDPITIRKELRPVKKKCQKVIGIDRDQNAANNLFLDEFRLITGTQFPIEDESIDLAFCDSVVEHVENYDLFFSECRRFLKSEGVLCLRTSNILHYVGLILKLIPNKLHANVLMVAQDIKKEEDISPTYYKYNTVSKLQRTLSKYSFEPEPGYLSFSRFFYGLGVCTKDYPLKCLGAHFLHMEENVLPHDNACFENQQKLLTYSLH